MYPEKVNDSKKCSKCLQIKPLEDFSSAIHGKYGKHSQCKLCKNAVSKIGRDNLSLERRNYRKLYNTDWKKKFRLKNKDYGKKYYHDNKERILFLSNKSMRLVQNEWLKILPINPHCEICGVKLVYFTKKNDNVYNRVNFDHKTGNEPIQGSPANWLTRNKCIEKNIKIWKDCDFGILCLTCNKNLPTIGRKEWLRKVIKYTKLEEQANACTLKGGK